MKKNKPDETMFAELRQDIIDGSKKTLRAACIEMKRMAERPGLLSEHELASMVMEVVQQQRSLKEEVLLKLRPRSQSAIGRSEDALFQERIGVAQKERSRLQHAAVDFEKTLPERPVPPAWWEKVVAYAPMITLGLDGLLQTPSFAPLGGHELIGVAMACGYAASQWGLVHATVTRWNSDRTRLNKVLFTMAVGGAIAVTSTAVATLRNMTLVRMGMHPPSITLFAGLTLTITAGVAVIESIVRPIRRQIKEKHELVRQYEERDRLFALVDQADAGIAEVKAERTAALGARVERMESSDTLLRKVEHETKVVVVQALNTYANHRDTHEPLPEYLRIPIVPAVVEEEDWSALHHQQHNPQ